MTFPHTAASSTQASEQFSSIHLMEQLQKAAEDLLQAMQEMQRIARSLQEAYQALEGLPDQPTSRLS